MNEEVNITKKGVTGWKRYFTLSYWLWQVRFIRSGGRPLNVVEVFTLEVTDPETLKLLEAVD